MCVCGAVDGGDSGVRHPTASGAVALQRAGGEQQVGSSFVSSSAPSAAHSSPLVLPLVEVVVLRLQLKAQGGVEGDDAADGGNTGSLVCSLQRMGQTGGGRLRAD